MQENLPEDNNSQNLEIVLEELFEKLFSKFSNPQPVIQEILSCTEGKPEQVELIVQKILESEYPNDTKQETEWIGELVQGGLIQRWVKTISKNEMVLFSEQVRIRYNHIQLQPVNNTRDTSPQTKILSGVGILIFCVIAFFLWPKNQNEDTQIESTSNTSIVTTQCFLAQSSFIKEVLIPAIDDSTGLQIETIEEWLNNEGKTVEETCLNKFYENYLNDIFYRYANKSINRQQYSQSIDYMCRITETHSEFERIRNRLRDWQTKREPISAYEKLKNMDTSSCPALRDLNE